MSWEAEKETVTRAARYLLSRGLVVATSGNVSMYLGEENGAKLLAVTPTSMSYADMKPEDIVVIDFDADVVEGYANPTSESLMHIAVYNARPDVKCVIHTHSTFASVLAVSGKELPPILDELVIHLGGPIRVAEYGFPGTEDLGERACAAMEGRNAVLLRNHGAIVAGRTVEDALHASELLERAAQVYVYSSALGAVGVLPPDIVESQMNIFKMLHGKDE